MQVGNIYPDDQQPGPSSSVCSKTRDLLENRIRSVDNLNQLGPSNTDKRNQQLSHDDSPTGAEGVKCALHGTIYQLKLSMLFLQTALKEKYKFKLYSEKRNAEKFDDVIFQYDRDRDKEYRFLQAKHKLYPEKDKISIKNLCSGVSNEPFNLSKYFISFRKIEQCEEYKGKIKDYIICTNTDFHDDIKIESGCGRLTEEKEDDDILDVGNGRRYKFIFEKNEDIVDKLKEASDLNRLAKELVKIAISTKKMHLTNELFKDYHVPLVKEVFDKKIFQEGANKRWHCKFKEDFIKNINLTEEAKLLQEALKNEALKKNLWDTISSKEFHVSPNFGEHVPNKKRRKECLPNDCVTDDEIKKFFRKLIFAVEQPSEEQLGEFIQERICNRLDYLMYDDVPAEFIYTYVQKEMLDWLKNSTSDALSKNNDFFTMAKEKLNLIMLSIFDKEYTVYIKSKGIVFNDMCKELKEFKEFLDSKNIIFNLVSSEECISLSQTKLYKVKQQSAWYLRILLYLKKFEKNKVKSLFSRNMLIIICNNESPTKAKEIEELYAELADYVSKNPNKKIVLITQGDSILANFFKNGYLKNNYKEISDMTRVEDLDQKYLENLLKKTIIFQGEEKTLATLIGMKGMNISELSGEEKKTLEVVLKQEMLCDLISDKSIVVGNKLLDFSDSYSPYYDPYHINITHNFSHRMLHATDLKECLAESKKDVFAFCSSIEDYNINLVPQEERDKIRVFSKRKSDEIFFDGRFFILDSEDPERDFKELLHNCNGKSVHWFTNCNNIFFLKQSSRLSKLRKFMVKNVIKKTEDLTDSVVIIAGNPGIGKSTLLTMYSLKPDVPLWFIRVNLKDHEVYTEKANFNNLGGIIHFLSKICPEGLETPLAKSLLKYHLEYQGQIVLLLDGYDEIKNHNQQKIIQLLNTLTDTKGKVWLTTRLNKIHDIENALGIFSYCLNPFDKGEQNEFLRQFWIKKLNMENSSQKEKDEIDCFTKKLLRYFSRLGLMKKGGLVEIVLQARMVAEILQDECREYLETKKFKPSEFRINNIFDLYKRFIECHYERYFKERLKINKYLTAGSQTALTKSYTKAHRCLAFKILFSEDQICEDFLRTATWQIFSQDEFCDMGLIINFTDTGIVDFVHHTYAEYFVAQLLVKMLGKKEDHPKYKAVCEFLFRNIYLDNNILIHNFFNHEIQKKWDLNSKWKAIQDCHLFRKVKTKRLLELEVCNTKTEIQHPEKSYTELKKNVKSHSTYKGSRYFFHGDVKLINEIFQIFFKKKNILKLKNILSFLININKKSCPAIKKNIHNAVEHYITQAKLENPLDDEFLKKILPKVIFRFTAIKNKFVELNSSPHNTDQIMEFINILLYKNYKDLNLLPILFPTIPYNIKQSIEQCSKDPFWLNKYGIKVVKGLKILTTEMSEQFCKLIRDDNGMYVDKIFKWLILPIIDMMKEKQLDNVVKLAFLKMLVRFTNFSVIHNRTLFFTTDQLKTTLELIEAVLKHPNVIALLESTKYLHVLGKAGLMLINAGQRLLVLDPKGGFQYELSSYKEYIVKLIKMMLENSENDNSLYNEAALQLLHSPALQLLHSPALQLLHSPVTLKRRMSENDLQKSAKRIKINIQD